MALSVSLLYVSFWAASVLGASSPLWVVGKDETAFEASNALNLSSPELLVNSNPGMVPGRVPEGATYTVSYTTPLNPPARWSTADGTTFLQLRERSAPPASTTVLLHSSGISSFLSEPTSSCVTGLTRHIQDSSTNEVVKRKSTYIDDTIHPSPRSTASETTPSRGVRKTAPPPAHSTSASKHCYFGEFDLMTKEELQASFSRAIGDEVNQVSLNADSDPLSWLYEDSQTGDLYDYSLGWILGCDSEVTQQVGNCADMLIDIFRSCDSNGGAGGYQTRQCLWFSYRPRKAQKL